MKLKISLIGFLVLFFSVLSFSGFAQKKISNKMESGKFFG